MQYLFAIGDNLLRFHSIHHLIYDCSPVFENLCCRGVYDYARAISGGRSTRRSLSSGSAH
eukprot:scaffold5237_cov179-Amphora_coffeaeformis.AAC.12